MEKADILELAVEYVKSLSDDPLSTSPDEKIFSATQWSRKSDAELNNSLPDDCISDSSSPPSFHRLIHGETPERSFISKCRLATKHHEPCPRFLIDNTEPSLVTSQDSSSFVEFFHLFSHEANKHHQPFTATVEDPFEDHTQFTVATKDGENSFLESHHHGEHIRIWRPW